MELNKSATHERRRYFGHPNGHSGENHESSSAREESEDQKHGHVLSPSHNSARQEDEECALCRCQNITITRFDPLRITTYKSQAAFSAKLIAPPGTVALSDLRQRVLDVRILTE